MGGGVSAAVWGGMGRTPNPQSLQREEEVRPVCDAWTKDASTFTINPHHLSPGLYTQDAGVACQKLYKITTTATVRKNLPTPQDWQPWLGKSRVKVP